MTIDELIARNEPEDPRRATSDACVLASALRVAMIELRKFAVCEKQWIASQLALHKINAIAEGP